MLLEFPSHLPPVDYWGHAFVSAKLNLTKIVVTEFAAKKEQMYDYMLW